MSEFNLTALRDKMLAVAPKAGWTGVQVYQKPHDPKGTLWIGFDAVQGTIRVSESYAAAYLEWLEAGNVGTIMKWASVFGRRLK